jgi:hypothetical protein
MSSMPVKPHIDLMADLGETCPAVLQKSSDNAWLAGFIYALELEKTS